MMIHLATSHASVVVTMGHLSTLVLPATSITHVYTLSFVSRRTPEIEVFVLGLDDPLIWPIKLRSWLVGTSLHFTPVKSWLVNLLEYSWHVACRVLIYMEEYHWNAYS
jgi:hypothetical protein